MTVRAAATDATRTRILDAAIEVFWERPLADISLEEVARRAGVSLPTVIRHFGTKESLFAAAGGREAERIRRQRDEAPVGDLRLAVRVLFDHYEDLGDAVLRLLAEAERVPALGVVADRGREVHAQWCERVFAPVLTKLSGSRRERRLSEFIVLTDVLVWKLLRRDRRLSRSEAELAMCEFIEPLMGGT
jgi:AcrR family transcriptional regulator